MKKLGKIINLLLLCVLAFPATAVGCGKEEKKSAVSLKFESVGGKYAATVTHGKTVWSNRDTGVFGVKVSYDNIRDVSDTEYALYDSYEEISGGYAAAATVTAEDGSSFKTVDTYRVSGDAVEVVRTFEVVTAGRAQGFMTYYPMRDVGQTVAAEQRKWFAPGSFYGNEEATFWGTGVKIGFSGESVANVDNLSAPVVTNYLDKKAFSVVDLTEGNRETVSEEFYAAENAIHVSDAFNIPGIGLRNVESERGTTTEIFHCYPANTYNFINCFPFTNLYRMLPVRAGLTREVAFEIRIEDYEDFDSAVESVWRGVYDRYAVIEHRYSLMSVYRALADNIYRSYGLLNKTPQYMVNTDHPYPESGFLYRNTDLAYLMIAAGYRLGKPEYIEQANTVLDYHIAKDLIVDNSVFKFERAETEGVIAVLNAYKKHLENGVDKRDWLVYVMKKAEQKKNVTDPMAIPLFLAVGEYIKDDSYVSRSAEILSLCEASHSGYYYTGAIENPAADAIGNRESGMVFMNVYLDMYRLTGEEKYLDHAKRCEVYVESNMILQNIQLETAGATGYEARDDGRFREIGTVGNAQFKPYGLSWVSGQTSSADNASAYSVADVLKLYDVTKEQKYLDFAEYLAVNSTLSVNMGDKSWLMDDIRHNAGMGFQNEYFGISASTDPVSSGRGTMHMSNLGWNMYVTLYGLESWASYGDGFMTDARKAYDTAALKYTNATSAQNTIYRAYNAVDNDPETMWRPAAADEAKELTVNLGEFISVQKVEMKHSGVKNAELYASTDGAVWERINKYFRSSSEVNGIFRFIKVKLTDSAADAGIKELKVIGNPSGTVNHAAGVSATAAGLPALQATDWNYRTSYNAGAPAGEIVVDLGEIREITDCSIVFNINVSFAGLDFIQLPVRDVRYAYKIEYSITGDVWKTYADHSDEAVMKAVYKDTAYAKARYFKITARASSGNAMFTEIKLIGA